MDEFTQMSIPSQCFCHVHTNCVLFLYNRWCKIFIKLFPRYFMSSRITLQDNKLALSNKKSQYNLYLPCTSLKSSMSEAQIKLRKCLGVDISYIICHIRFDGFSIIRCGRMPCCPFLTLGYHRLTTWCFDSFKTNAGIMLIITFLPSFSQVSALTLEVTISRQAQLVMWNSWSLTWVELVQLLVLLRLLVPWSPRVLRFEINPPILNSL